MTCSEGNDIIQLHCGYILFKSVSVAEHQHDHKGDWLKCNSSSVCITDLQDDLNRRTDIKYFFFFCKRTNLIFYLSNL